MFSVIIPTYNRADLLAKCLDSLVLQTYKDFEVLVCDDGSTDNTSQVVLSYSNCLEIKYFYQLNSGGPAGPRNSGISNAKYDWVCFLDADDYWYPNKLLSLYNAILHKEYDIFCHHVDVIDINSEKRKIIGKYKCDLFSNDFNTLLYNGGGVVNSSLCVRRSLLHSSYLYDVSVEYHGVEDFIFILNLTYNKAKIKTIKKVLGCYRIHGSNISSDVNLTVNKLKYFFKNCLFENIDYQKLETLLIYLKLSATSDYSAINKIKEYLNIICFRRASFRIKLKSSIKLIYCIINVK